MASPALVKGFTLLELMLTVTVAGIILGLGIPNMTQFIRNSRMTSAANDLLAGVHMARTEAVKRRAWTTLCFSADPTEATPVCDGNGTQGWIVFADANADLTVDGGEEVLLRHDALPTSLSVNVNDGAANGGYISFAGSGFARPTAGEEDIADVVLCDERGNVAVYGDENSAARAIRISPTGRPQVNRAVSEVTAAGGCP
jgi:type IV fimbrial biogenesis protein FimT